GKQSRDAGCGGRDPDHLAELDAEHRGKTRASALGEAPCRHVHHARPRRDGQQKGGEGEEENRGGGGHRVDDDVGSRLFGAVEGSTRLEAAFGIKKTSALQRSSSCYVPVLTSDTSVRRTIRERRIRVPTGSGRSAARSTKFAATKRGDRPRRKAGEGERERSGQQPSVYLLVIDRRASRAPPIKETSQAGRLLPLLAPNVRYRKRTRSGRPHRLALHHVHDGDQDDGPDQGDDERDDKARRLGSEEQGEDESAQE